MISNNTIYRLNVANLIDLLIGIESLEVREINIHFYPEKNKMKITRVGEPGELPEHFTVDDLIK